MFSILQNSHPLLCFDYRCTHSWCSLDEHREVTWRCVWATLEGIPDSVTSKAPPHTITPPPPCFVVHVETMRSHFLPRTKTRWVEPDLRFGLIRQVSTGLTSIPCVS